VLRFPKLEVRKIPKLGRGVFTLSPIKKDSIIEVCYAILLPIPEDAKHNPAVEYAFRWNKKHVAIALGNGSLYNHSYTPNACIAQDTRSKTIEVYALQNIQAGEQIFINYNGKPDCTDPLWFNVK